MNLSLLQTVYTVPLWHFWVEIAHGGSCMNCSFRRMIWSFLQKLLCYYHGDCSLWAFPPLSANPPLTKNGDFSHFNVLTLGNFPGYDLHYIND